MFVRRSYLEQNPVFSIAHDFGYENLVVSGCSFTFNNSETHASSWPYYLRELGGFKKVYDCSLPGAGNYHISHALQWSLTQEGLDPSETLVLVMWSGHDRDDTIAGVSALDPGYTTKHYYTPGVVSAVTGGSILDARGNTRNGLDCMRSIKTPESRAVENYLYIDALRAWLVHNGYRSVFVDYLDPSLPNRTRNFNIRDHLPTACQQRLDAVFADCVDIYAFCVKNDLLYEDDLHPSANGHLAWTRQCLIPCLKSLNIDNK
jgi:hypothetical protein